MLLRLLVVVVLLGATAAATVAYRRRRLADEQLGATGLGDDGRWPALPTELAMPGEATWVIFSTPLCVSCDAVRSDLTAHDPETRVITVDATERPDLADRYGVRRAPTTILAEASGRITERLVGPEAVRDHLRGTTATSSVA